MDIRRVVTESSIWMFDMDAKMFCRVPRTEENTHISLDYEDVGAWEEFTEIIEPENTDEPVFDGITGRQLTVNGEHRRLVIRKLKAPFACTTGWIESDTHPNAEVTS